MRKRRQRGFTLLLAAIIASIVLALGSAIFMIAQKEVTLSAIGRDSQFAFYAADTAAECALYWDIKHSYFAPTTPSITPTCDAQSMQPFSVTPDESQPYAYPYTMTSQQVDVFRDTKSGNPGYCVQVWVKKCDGKIKNDANYTCESATPPVIHTLIHADGYSVDCSEISSSPRALQRSIELRN